jgi:hypothetical protein
VTSPDSTATRRAFIKLARDFNIPVSILNAVLTSIGLNPYSTTDMTGTVVLRIEFAPSDVTPRPTLAEAAVLFKTTIDNSPLNPATVRERQGFDVLSFTGDVLQLRVYFAVRPAILLAQAEFLVSSVLTGQAYSTYVTVPQFTASLTNFVWDTVDPDNPA